MIHFLLDLLSLLLFVKFYLYKTVNLRLFTYHLPLNFILVSIKKGESQLLIKTRKMRRDRRLDIFRFTSFRYNWSCRSNGLFWNNAVRRKFAWDHRCNSLSITKTIESTGNNLVFGVFV